jgi:hypothetical protein
MQQIGLNEAAARTNSLGSHTPGAFFTHLLGPPKSLVWDYRWRTNGACDTAPCLLYSLEASRLIITQPVPGAKAEYHVPLETVFYPASYPTVNQHVHWQIIDPYGAWGEERSA